MNPYRSQYKDRSPFSSTAASALSLPSLSDINSEIKNNPFDFNKFYQTGLLEDYKNRISIHDSHWKEYATRLQSIKGREQARARFAQQDAAGEANEAAGGLNALTSVATPVEEQSLSRSRVGEHRGAQGSVGHGEAQECVEEYRERRGA